MSAKSIGNLKKLKHLYIGNTQITRLPDGLENLENLETLEINIANLDLKDVVEKIKNLPRLTSLSICNQLSYPDNFCELVQIKKLFIEQNYVLKIGEHKNLPIPENVTLLPNLEELYLTNNNQANRLPKSMHRLKNLKKLQMYSTSIQSFPESMHYLNQIQSTEGNLNKDVTSPFGILPIEKEKLIRWFPNAKIQIY